MFLHNDCGHQQLYMQNSSTIVLNSIARFNFHVYPKYHAPLAVCRLCSVNLNILSSSLDYTTFSIFAIFFYDILCTMLWCIHLGVSTTQPLRLPLLPSYFMKKKCIFISLPIIRSHPSHQGLTCRFFLRCEIGLHVKRERELTFQIFYKVWTSSFERLNHSISSSLQYKGGWVRMSTRLFLCLSSLPIDNATILCIRVSFANCIVGCVVPHKHFVSWSSLLCNNKYLA